MAAKSEIDRRAFSQTSTTPCLSKIYWRNPLSAPLGDSLALLLTDTSDP